MKLVCVDYEYVTLFKGVFGVFADNRSFTVRAVQKLNVGMPVENTAFVVLLFNVGVEKEWNQRVFYNVRLVYEIFYNIYLPCLIKSI